RFSRVVIVVFIVVTGLIASRLASRSPSLLSALTLPKSLADFRDSVTGEQYSFADPAVALRDLEPGSRITVDNSYGEVKAVGGSCGARRTLTKVARPWSEEAARPSAANIKHFLNPPPDGLNKTTTRNQLDQQFTTGLLIEIPSSSSISINDSYGTVTA